MEFIKPNNLGNVPNSNIYSGNKDQAAQYYLQEGTGSGDSPSTVSLGASAAAAELGVVDTKNSLQVHNIETVEKPTEAKKLYPLNNVKSIYKEPTEVFNKDYFKAYYGININTKL